MKRVVLMLKGPLYIHGVGCRCCALLFRQVEFLAYLLTLQYELSRELAHLVYRLIVDRATGTANVHVTRTIWLVSDYKLCSATWVSATSEWGYSEHRERTDFCRNTLHGFAHVPDWLCDCFGFALVLVFAIHSKTALHWHIVVELWLVAPFVFWLDDIQRLPGTIACAINWSIRQPSQQWPWNVNRCYHLTNIELTHCVRRWQIRGQDSQVDLWPRVRRDMDPTGFGGDRHVYRNGNQRHNGIFVDGGRNRRLQR